MGATGRAATAGRWALIAVVLVLLVVPGRLLAAEHHQDDALVQYAGQRAGGRVLAGQTWHADAGVVASGADALQLIAVRPRVTVDTAEAEITVRLCRPAHHTGQVGSTAPLSDGCRGISDVPTRTPVRLLPGAVRIVVSVTPSRAGRVQIEGYDVTYVDGGHRGTEHAGQEVVVRAS